MDTDMDLGVNNTQQHKKNAHLQTFSRLDFLKCKEMKKKCRTSLIIKAMQTKMCYTLKKLSN